MSDQIEVFSLGKILRSARERNGKSQLQIANTLGLSQNYISAWERDKVGLVKSRWERVASAYGLEQKEKTTILENIAWVSQKKEIPAANQMREGVLLPPEVLILNELLALSQEKRQWVIEAATAHASLDNQAE